MLSGSQSLGPMMNLRLAQPDQLVDLGGIQGLDGIELTGNSLTIGARVTHARIEDGDVPGETGDYLRFVASGISYRSVRNRGTIGGSMAHADPSADWPAALLALGGEVLAAGPRGNRNLPLDGFQIGPFMTSLEPDEILTALELPRLGDGDRWGYYKICRKPGEFADAIGAVVLKGDARAVCGATGGAPFRVPSLEQRLNDGLTGLTVEDARQMVDELGPGFDDYELQIHAVALVRAIGRAFS